ncbi:MAG: tail fiber domain-containing protein [Cytophagaceae bacterium]
MKNFTRNSLSFLFLSFICNVSYGQSNVGIGTITPNSKAALEVVSTGNNQGILIPRLSAVQRLAIPVTAAENSLLVYDKDSAAFMYWNGAIWKPVGGSSSTVTASNGLTKTASNITLGGTLTSATTINTAGFNVSYTGAGNMGIGLVPSGTYKLEVNGLLKTNGVTEMSDVRWKRNILPIDHALTRLMKLRGVTYNWKVNEYKEKNFESETQIGLIAQEVEQVFPELVKTDANGYKSVEYSKVVAILIQAVKEQQALITEQQEQITDLKVQTSLDEQKYQKLVQVLLEKGVLDSNWNQKLSSEAVTK